MRMREKLSLVPAIIAEGIALWIDPPRRLKLRVDHDWEERREREQREMEERHGAIRRPPLPRGLVTCLPPAPPMKRIHLECTDRDGSLFGATIAIDLETKRIDYGSSSAWLFGKEHKGSGAIGVIFLSLPVTLPLSPILLAVNDYYRLMEKRRQMSRHSHAILRALKGQLDPETEALLSEAMQNSWRDEQAMSRQVSLEEAKEILDRCDLREDCIDAETAARRGEAEAHGFHWFDDDGNQVAYGSCSRRDHYVHVLGSMFKDDDADALIGRYRSRTVHYFGRDN